MRGVKCSWKEMQRLHREVLPAIQRGDGERYAEMRCVAPNSVSDWRAASAVMEVIDAAPEFGYPNFKQFMPSHATLLARHFRKTAGKQWDDATKGQIMDWVDRCESEAMTVEDLRFALKADEVAGVDDAKSHGLVTSLSELVNIGAKFKAIYADPPWAYSNKATRSAVDGVYKSTMTIAEICAEPVAQLAEDNCHLWLWTTTSFLPDSFKVMESWGFTYKTNLVWIKPQMGIGNYVRVSHEHLLLGVRGTLRTRTRGEMSWVSADRTKHSRKPVEFRKLVERNSYGPYLEMYGRSYFGPPWTVYGNEVEDKESRVV